MRRIDGLPVCLSNWSKVPTQCALAGLAIIACSVTIFLGRWGRWIATGSRGATLSSPLRNPRSMRIFIATFVRMPKVRYNPGNRTHGSWRCSAAARLSCRCTHWAAARRSRSRGVEAPCNGRAPSSAASTPSICLHPLQCTSLRASQLDVYWTHRKRP